MIQNDVLEPDQLQMPAEISHTVETISVVQRRDLT